MGDEQDVASRIEALEARIQELEDERALRELLARYGFNADCCRDEAYLDLFTDDGVVNLTSSTREGVIEWTGKDELREFITDATGHHKPGFYGKSMHVQGNNVVTHIDKDSGVVDSYSVVLQAEDGKVTLVGAGNNQWQFKKVDGKWLIKERRRRQLGDQLYITNLDATPE